MGEKQRKNTSNRLRIHDAPAVAIRFMTKKKGNEVRLKKADEKRDRAEIYALTR